MHPNRSSTSNGCALHADQGQGRGLAESWRRGPAAAAAHRAGVPAPAAAHRWPRRAGRYAAAPAPVRRADGPRARDPAALWQHICGLYLVQSDLPTVMLLLLYVKSHCAFTLVIGK